MHLSHFPILVLCALLIAVVFGCVFEDTAKARILASIRYLVLLVVTSVIAGWLMYLLGP